MQTKKIGFIGAGNMATSLISGLIASGHPEAQIWVSDHKSENLHLLAQNYAVHTTTDNLELVNMVDVIVLAVKPQVLQAVALEIAAALKTRTEVLLVSIAAGIQQTSLQTWLGKHLAIVRCMPNTPALVASSATALHANNNVTAWQQDLAENILRAVGICLWVETEAELDTVTAVSGSGPAYFFLLMEAMEKIAIDLGLSQATARLLIQQTALGSAKIALESKATPTQLRQQVTSAGGTTQAAIETFNNNGFTQLVAQAIQAAQTRSIELSQQLGQD